MSFLSDVAAIGAGPLGGAGILFGKDAATGFGNILTRGRGPQEANYNYNYTPEFDWARANADYQAQNQARTGMMSAAEQARLQAEGKLGPSLAQLQLQDSMARAAQEQAQMAASARGGPAAVAAAQRQSMAAAAGTQAATAAAAGQQRVAEQNAAYQRELAALQGAGQVAGQQRQGSLAMSQAEVDANMQAERYRQEGRMGYDAAATGADKAYRDRMERFYGKFIDQASAGGTKAVTGGLG